MDRRCRRGLEGAHVRGVALVAALAAAMRLAAQMPAPIAIVPMDSKDPGRAASVTGALDVTHGKALIVASGTVTAGAQTAVVTLPRRGLLRVCASTTVRLAADTSMPASETPGLMMAIDHGALEASFATGRNSDILMTPDFRILISGPGAADVKVRLGAHGDTCVDNAGTNAPYVLVTSVFDQGDYHVRTGQRVLFERGSVHEVVDNEKESCGCPPATIKGNEFPLAQSEGLAPPPPPPPPGKAHSEPTKPIEPLIYKSEEHAPQPVAQAAPAQEKKAAAKPSGTKKKKRSRLARFFRKLFGADLD